MLFTSTPNRKRNRASSTSLRAIESLEDRRALTAMGITSGVADAVVPQHDFGGPRTGSFTAYDFGLDTVVAQADQPNGLLPAVQKATATNSRFTQPRADSFTAYDFGLDTVVATDQVFADF